MYYIYAIYNKQCDQYYIGQTFNLSDRLLDHNQHAFKGYTSRFEGEWKLFYCEKVATRSEALKRERQLKSFRGREFIKKYVPN